MSTMRQTVRISDIIIPKYLPIFNNTKYRHIILTSGRAGTKSSYAAIRADYQIVADDKGSVVVLRKHHNKLRKTVYKEMLRGIARLGISKDWFRITKSPMEISYKKNGSTIYFSGSDGIDDTKGIIDEERPIKLVILNLYPPLSTFRSDNGTVGNSVQKHSVWIVLPLCTTTV